MWSISQLGSKCNLFEIFDEASQKLQQSLQFAGFKHETIVMDDDGFLPDNVMNPYQFFANYKRNDDDKPAFLMRFKCHHYGKLKVIIIMQKL